MDIMELFSVMVNQIQVKPLLFWEMILIFNNKKIKSKKKAKFNIILILD